MSLPDSLIPDGSAMAWLAGTYWYCPTPNLPAPVLVNGPGGPQVTMVQDQTIWHFTTAAGGYLVGDCATNLGGTWSYMTIVGSLTPAGGVSLSFTPDSPYMAAPGGLSPASLTIGLGDLVLLAGEPAFLMQMSSGSAAASLTHWAYMLQMAPGDLAWTNLPGTVPRGVEEVFRAGRTADSTVPGIDALGRGSAEYIPGSGRADLLRGLGGADTLQGGDDADTLQGGFGNDLLLGEDGRDRLAGGAGRDTLAGGAGSDVLWGGQEADAFRFDAPLASAERDRIADFQPGLDRLEIDASGFGGGLAEGALPAAAFEANLTGLATSDSTRLIHETDRGWLWWDADGSGAGARVAIAVLAGAPALAASDVLVIA